MNLRDELSQYRRNIQGSSFAWLKQELGELTEKQQMLGTLLELVRVEDHSPGCVGFVSLLVPFHR